MPSARLRTFFNSRPGILLGIILVTILPLLAFSAFPAARRDYVSTLSTLLVILAYLYLRGSSLRELGLGRPESWPRTLALTLFYTAVGFVLLRMLLEPSLELLTGRHRDLSSFDFLKGNPGALMGFLLTIWLTVPINEELYFRGFLITQTAALFRTQRAGWTVGILVSAALFAWAHAYQGLNGMLFTAVGGVFLGAIFVGHRRNLWLPILIHLLSDTISMVLIYFGAYAKVTHLLF